MRTAYRAARLFDGTRPLSSPSGMAVVVRDGRVEAVGPATAVVAGCFLVDLGDATIMPGLVDAHAHLADAVERVPREPYALTVLRAANHAAAHLRTGVTVVRDVGSTRRLAADVARAIDAGIVPGPRILAPGDDSPVPGPRHAPLPDELAALVHAGATAAQALRAATRDAAQLLGVGADHGTLEPGKRADLLVVGGDPCVDLAALRDVRLVLLDGRTIVDTPGAPASPSTHELVHACRTVLRALSAAARHPDLSSDQQRVLLAVGRRAEADIVDLRAALGIDAGQLSRAVRALEAGGAVEVRQCPADRRRRTVAVTEAGRRAYEQLTAAHDRAAGELLDRFSAVERARLVSAMQTVYRLVGTALRR